MQQRERGFLKKLKELDLIDTYRQVDEQTSSFTWWDYGEAVSEKIMV